MNSNHQRRLARAAFAAIILSCAALPASAYVGPGAGLTLLGALWGLVLAVVMSVGFVILWPFRRMLRRRKRGAGSQSGQDVEHLADDTDNTMLANKPDRAEDR